MDFEQYPAYIPGRLSKAAKPLGRFRPPVQAGVASTWLTENVSPGSWLLDPFGAAPELVLEAARQGYRILVAANNPINRFILETLANPPSKSDFQGALAALAATTIGKERLEPHIKSLYTTICAECQAKIPVEAYLWKSGSSSPYGRIYTCPHCDDSGERPITPADIAAAERFGKSGLHQARALERVVPLNDPDRSHAEEALSVYPPRAIYVLVTIINKLNTLSRDQQRYLAALLLVCFDQANTLWPHPVERARPRQLTIPPQYRENNIWLALEQAVSLWTTGESATELTFWPETPPAEGGICLFKGRIKTLASQISNLKVGAIITAFPRPNQAFWTLSALWSGWLWGPEAVEHFKSVLRRRRYDWGWHTTAIAAALSNLKTEHFENFPLWGTINEVEPGFLSAVALGAKIADFRLSALSLRAAERQAQFLWQGFDSAPEKPETSTGLEEIIPTATRAYLQTRGEPSTYIYCHAAGLTEIAAQTRIDPSLSPYDYFGQIQATFQQELSYRNKFLRYEGSSNSLDVGQWWLADPSEVSSPLADHVEKSVVQFLVQTPTTNFGEIDQAICAEFPGLLSPDPQLIQVCLDSYGQLVAGNDDRWALQTQDAPTKRRGDLQEMEKLLEMLGARLRYQVNLDQNLRQVQWNLKDKVEYTFFISATAILGKYLSIPISEEGKFIVVLPGSRANLVAYKLKHNPHFAQIADQHWHFLKYRHLRQLAENETLNISILNDQLGLDPLTYSEPQLRLF